MVTFRYSYFRTCNIHKLDLNQSENNCIIYNQYEIKSNWKKTKTKKNCYKRVAQLML